MIDRTYAPPVWDFYGLLTILGTTTEIQRMIAKRGFNPPPRETIQGWRNRNSIPAYWVPLFIQFGLEGNFINSVEDLLAERKPRHGLPDNTARASQ
jgi:hypothetical protein